jgi:TonB family protein
MDLPLGPGARTRGGASPDPSASPSPSLTASIRDLEQRLNLGQLGARSGAAGRTMGPLFFDPEGADFTAWLNHFKDEVYRNWIVPQAAQFGYSRGHVDIQFVVVRNGAIGELNILKSSGTPALDRAAVNALRGSRFLPLPADYGPAQVTMQVTFDYGGEGPRG